MAVAKNNRAKRGKGVTRGAMLWMRSGALLLAAAAIVVALYWIHEKLQDPAVMPVRSVVFKGSFKELGGEDLQEVVTRQISGGFITLDVSAVQSALKNLQWVAAVTVRRVWPDALVITIEEHAPVARWGESELISDRGVVFAPGDVAPFAGLTRIDADERFAAEVMQQYRRMSALLQGYGSIARIRRNALSGVTLWLDSGVRIELGNSGMMKRLARAKVLLERLPARVAALEVIDARYSGGVAVRFKQQDQSEEQSTESHA
jgi:cell division protein FtsQ